MSKLNSITLAILSVLATSSAWAEDETFDTHFMIGGLNGEKISDYHIDSDKPMPGIYDMDVYLNNQWRGHYNVDIKDDPDATCLSWEQLKQIGILTEGINIDKSVECVPLRDAVQGGSVDYDIGHFNLKLSVPQAYVVEYERGYVPPEAWDRGINALYTSYYASQYYSNYKHGGDNKSSYLNLNSGLNLLGWQLHSNANYTKSDESSGKWKSNTLYLERGIPQILGTLVLVKCIPVLMFLTPYVFAVYAYGAICRCCRTLNRTLLQWCVVLPKVTHLSLSNKMALWFTRKRFRQVHSPLMICNLLVVVQIWK